MIFRGVFVMRLSFALAVWGGTMGGGLMATTPAQAQAAFPYGQELRMDADPMKGSKKVPILDITENGVADIELWCDAVRARLVVAGETVTVLTEARTTRSCPPERAQADTAMIEALEQATHWKVVGDALVLSGGPTELRFRKQGN